MHATKIRHLLLPALVLSVLANAAAADVRLPAIFTDHMVMQRDSNVAVWGWAEPGEVVRIEAGWSDEPISVTTDATGNWRGSVPTGPAGGPHTLTVSSTNTVNFEDVLLGEVWVCSGQSNMEWSLDACAPLYTDVKAAANYPRLRLFDVKNRFATAPQEDCTGSWSACTPEGVGGFSAVAFFFGLDLMNELDVPVGLIGSNWGGTVAETWTSEETLRDWPYFDDALAQVRSERDLPADSEVKRVAHQNSPTTLFNGMLAPIIPFGIRGAIWYQGESNCTRAEQYVELFPAMIADWRKHWGRGDFPFYYVQIAPFNYNNSTHAPALLREAQRLALRVPNTGMAVTMDIGVAGDIHPKNKLDVGKRLALWALKHTYGQALPVWSGPLYKSVSKEAGALRVHFDHVGGGLRGPDELTHFEIAGSDREWKTAVAKIDGDTILVSSPECAAPEVVRYAWGNADMPGLANAEGLPASSFCSDVWPATSSAKQDK